MAESYFIAGQECLGPSANTDDPAGWRNFCDCMFLQPVEVAELFSNGARVILRYPDRVADVASSRAELETATQALLAQGRTVEVRSVVRNLRSPQWEQCVKVLCALPFGCRHPADESIIVPFDVAPGLLAPPWTDVGAGARRIPKKGAGLSYDLVGQLFSIDPRDYTPLALWTSYTGNIAKFFIDSVKVGIFAPPLAPIISMMLVNPQVGIPLLMPFALAQCAVEGKDVWGYVVRPMLLGSAQTVVFALRSLGSVVSGRWAELAGALVAKFSEDQIATGQINSMSEPMQGIVVFFSKHGEELGRRIQEVLTGGFKLESAPDVMGFLATIFNTLSSAPGMPEQAAAMFRLMSKSIRVAEIVARGLSERPQWMPERIVDRICVEVFGFSFSELKRTVLAGPAAVMAMFNSAKTQNYFQSPQDALKLFQSISAGFNEIIGVVTEANRTFDGALSGFRAIFEEAKLAFGVMTEPVEGAVIQAVAVSEGHGAAQPAKPAAQPVVSKAVALSRPVPSVVPPGPGGAMLLGAGAGFLSAGPPGAVGGAILGYIMRPKLAQNVTSKAIVAAQTTPVQSKATTQQSIAAKQPPTNELTAFRRQSASGGFAGYDAWGAESVIRKGNIASTWEKSPEFVVPPAPAAPASPSGTSVSVSSGGGVPWGLVIGGSAAVGILVVALSKKGKRK